MVSLRWQNEGCCKRIQRMSQRSRASRLRLHAHCDSCYSRRCRARVEASVSCPFGPCRLRCGALFHLCKEEEHLLLCPSVRVPCLNAAYGCPLQLPRSSRAAHLQACPASVVCCSMEWNRWPAHDAHSHLNTELHQNLLSGREQGGWLDLALALRDQDQLFHSIKMRKLFPELIQSVEEEEKEEERREEERRREKERQKKAALEEEAAAKEAHAHTWVSFNAFKIYGENKEESDDEDELEARREPTLTQEQREALASASGVDADLLVNYNAWERMFSMEMGGCREAGGAGVAATGRGRSLGTVTEEEPTEACAGASAGTSSSSARPAHKPRRSFVYGHLEPMKIITVRTFKIPTSFCARQSRIRNPGFYRRVSRAVDTGDLEVAPDEMPVWEEVQASLLCSLEKEQRGHLIAESVCTDGLLQDEGTQTYSFLSAPFRRSTSLADLTAARPLELHLQLQVEAVTSRHNKASSAFTFLCGHTFRRREYGHHYRNAHSDIQMGANGWFQQRCPLAFLGCTYSHPRFQPSTHEATVQFHEGLGCFTLHPAVPQRPRGRGGGEASLSALPYEVLCHVAAFLDSFSLSQLALASRLMRQVCSSLLQERGMVTLRWERQVDPRGAAAWRVKQTVWQFSTLFSTVDSWRFRDAPPISEHLKVCPYYERETREERVLLPRVEEDVQTSRSCRGPTLVGLFQHRRIKM
ncbi:F-box protein 40.1 [Betta splendens]|uniref:F-box protein 40.1 n=1 Tax=Betta splendens TaxID=158456 RepID=A0A6P7PAX4_BETSP|nr:F-box protein 40.1 [Betta splendens]